MGLEAREDVGVCDGAGLVPQLESKPRCKCGDLGTGTPLLTLCHEVTDSEIRWSLDVTPRLRDTYRLASQKSLFQTFLGVGGGGVVRKHG